MAETLLEAFPGAQLVGVYVHPVLSAPVPDLLLTEEVVEAEAETAQKVIATAQEQLARFGGRARLVERHGSPPIEICALAEEVDADLIIVGSHGKGALERAFLGSVSRGVLGRTARPVLVVQ